MFSDRVLVFQRVLSTGSVTHSKVNIQMAFPEVNSPAVHHTWVVAEFYSRKRKRVNKRTAVRERSLTIWRGVGGRVGIISKVKAQTF